MNQAAALDVMLTLRESTMEKHKLAERHPLQHAMATGKLPRAQYAAMTAQMMIVHRELFAALNRSRGVPPIAAVLRDYHDHEPSCRRDIEHFGVDASLVVASASTSRFIAEIKDAESSSPLALLGALYVLEGATNGGKYIARVVKLAYRLDAGKGAESLEPYAEAQPQRWEEFKQSMRGVAFGEGEIAHLVAMACRTFDAVAEIGDDVLNGRV
ncbi:MAG: biliverdin-producing heme oxygenase [Phycisphaerales bacterium]|jgi:heme oxygenase|nr:biliverdin-producing heme oxygenase [Phycisphaerales bacterium]